MNVLFMILQILNISGDTLGMILAWFSLLPSFTVISFIPVIILRRDLTTVGNYKHTDKQTQVLTMKKMTIGN